MTIEMNLDVLAKIAPICREVYGYDPDVKPNDHCVWVEIGHSQSIMAWVETDAHLRQRLKLRKEKINEDVS